MFMRYINRLMSAGRESANPEGVLGGGFQIGAYTADQVIIIS
jgi:hypothetical protein